MYAHVLQGLHSIGDDVFLSLPCVLGENGVRDLVKQLLTEEELRKLHESASLMSKVQADLTM